MIQRKFASLRHKSNYSHVMSRIGSPVYSTNDLKIYYEVVSLKKCLSVMNEGRKIRTRIGVDQENNAPDKAKETQSAGVPINYKLKK